MCHRCGGFAELAVDGIDRHPSAEPEPDGDAEDLTVDDLYSAAEGELLTQIRLAPTKLVLAVLGERGAEFGTIEIGGISGRIVLLQPSGAVDDEPGVGPKG